MLWFKPRHMLKYFAESGSAYVNFDFFLWSRFSQEVILNQLHFRKINEMSRKQQLFFGESLKFLKSYRNCSAKFVWKSDLNLESIVWVLNNALSPNQQNGHVATPPNKNMAAVSSS